MKYSLFFFASFIVFFSSAQKSTKYIEFSDKRKLWNYSIINNGEFVFHQSQYTLTGSPKNGILKYYDSDSNEIKSVILDKKRIALLTTTKFKYLLGDGFVTDGSSIKTFDSKTSKLYRRTTPSFTYNDYIYTHYGINLKKDENFALKRLDPSSLTHTDISFKIPNLESYKGEPTFNVKFGSNPITFLLKEYKNKHEDAYHILHYNEDLEFINQTDLIVDLGDKFLRPSNNGVGGFETIESAEYLTTDPNGYSRREGGNIIARRPDEGTMGNVFIHSNGYYCYGMYGDTEDKSKSLFNNQTFFENYTGFFIYSFDKNGKVLWKNFYPLLSEKLNKGKLMAYRNVINIEKNSINKNLLISIRNRYEKKIEITEINTDNGQLVKNSSHDIILYKPNPPILGFYGLQSSFYLKESFGKKIKFSIGAIGAVFSNQEFYDYVKLKSEEKSTLSYDAKYTIDGLTVFEELDKKKGKYKILKF